MRIALFVTTFPNVSETFILHQMTGLLDRAHELDIWAARPGSETTLHADVERYHLLRHTFYWGIDARDTSGPRVARALWATPAAFWRLCRRPAGLARALNVWRRYRRSASPTLFFGASSLLRHGAPRYDIIHCHYGSNGTLAVLLRELGVITGKVITSFHGYDISGYVQSHGRDIYDPLFALGDIFLPVSERWRAELISLGCQPDRITLHRMGVDLSKFAFMPRDPRRHGGIRLLTVARLVEKKGLPYALRAVARLIDDWPQITYRIVGDGPLRSELLALIGELGISRHVSLLGAQSHEAVAAIMRDADLFLLPSVVSAEGDQEGIPVSLMEAMAAGLPVLTTRHSGIPELVQDGVSGFLVPEGDVDALTERLQYLLEHPGVWAEMGRAGHTFVREHHEISKTTDELVGIYSRLAGTSRARSDSVPAGSGGEVGALRGTSP